MRRAKVKEGILSSSFKIVANALSVAASIGSLIGVVLQLFLENQRILGAALSIVGVASAIFACLSAILERNLISRVVDKFGVYERLFSSLRKKDKVTPAAATTAIAALARRKTNQRQIGTITILASLAIYATARWWLELPLSFAVIATLAGSCFLLQMAGAALDYRIRHGLYGTNEYEARQIVVFALNHASSTDLDGGLGSADIQIDAATEKLIYENWGVATS